jgi:hypothetical protein
MRYYFHLRVGRELSPDEIGIDMPDLDTAYLEAFQAAQAMWSELLASAGPMLRSQIAIRMADIADPAVSRGTGKGEQTDQAQVRGHVLNGRSPRFF